MLNVIGVESRHACHCQTGGVGTVLEEGGDNTSKQQVSITAWSSMAKYGQNSRQSYQQHERENGEGTKQVTGSSITAEESVIGGGIWSDGIWPPSVTTSCRRRRNAAWKVFGRHCRQRATRELEITSPGHHQVGLNVVALVVNVSRRCHTNAVSVGNVGGRRRRG